MTKYQAERLFKKAKKYPHQLTDAEIEFLSGVIHLARAIEETNNLEIKEDQ